MINDLLDDPLFARSAPHESLLGHPLGFVDIGARGGIHEVVEPLAGATAVLGFEPDEEECKRLSLRSAELPWADYRIEPLALAGGRGRGRLRLLSWSQNNSMLSPNKEFVRRYKMSRFEEVGSNSVRTTTLDEAVFEDSKTKWGEFLKLDTQGTELEILQAAERTLSERTVAIMTEVEFAQLYQDQKLFSEVELFLRRRGFSFYGFMSTHHRSQKRLDKRIEAGRERLLHGDAIFFKDPLPGGFSERPLSDRGNHTLFVCAVLLGFYDFALELALNTWAKGSEGSRIEKLIHARAFLPAGKTSREVELLAKRIRAKPRLANVIVGHFVDERRNLHDYQDTPEA